jgi:hypothetical protein
LILLPLMPLFRHYWCRWLRFLLLFCFSLLSHYFAKIIDDIDIFFRFSFRRFHYFITPSFDATLLLNFHYAFIFADIFSSISFHFIFAFACRQIFH